MENMGAILLFLKKQAIAGRIRKFWKMSVEIETKKIYKDKFVPLEKLWEKFEAS